MKRRISHVLFGLIVTPMLHFALMQAQPAVPQTYSATVVNALLGPPVTFRIYRDGTRELVDRVQPSSPGVTPSHIMQLFDFQAGTAFIWDALDSKAPCSKSTTTDKAVDFTVDPISGVAQWMAEIDPSKSKSVGTETVNGIATRVMEAVDPASKTSGKVWQAEKGNYLIKYVVTPSGGTPRVMFEITALSFNKPAASVFAMPASCNGIAVTGSFSSGPAAAPADHKITAATVTITPATYKGPCTPPAHLQMAGTITADGPGTAWYRFEFGGTFAQGQEGTVGFTQAGTKNVSRDVTFTQDGGGSGYLSAAMVDKGGRHDAGMVNSPNADYDITCITVTTPDGNTDTVTAVPIRINAGGPAQTDVNGIRWESDKGYSDGEMYTNTRSAIAGTKTPSLYQTNRFCRSDFEYAFNVANGSYVVTLKFAEIYFTKPGQRVFHVEINGRRVLNHFDTFLAADGPNKAIDMPVPVEVTNGRLLIHFTKVVENPQISALEIIKGP